MKHFITDNSKVTGIEVVNSSNQPEIIQADLFVLCTGAHIGQHTSIPILPITGITTEIDNVKPLLDEPKIAVHTEQKLFWANLGSKIRIGQGIEILRSPDELRKFSTVDEKLESFQRTRAVSPDGLPIIGQVSNNHSNVYMVGGLGFYGWTLGFAAGQILGKHILYKTPIPKSFDSKRLNII
jgi:glycine/D-amino acid oxidase-like deaminating enzyme